MTSSTSSRNVSVQVRIAPVERWCKDALSYWEGYEASLVGRVIHILPCEMKVMEGERNWPLTEEDSKAIGALDQKWEQYNRLWLCESMLEMD